jgi:hypothetical protein
VNYLAAQLNFLLRVWPRILKFSARDSSGRMKMNVHNKHVTTLPLWDVPVFVRIGNGLVETIDGPEEALAYLDGRWPAERGPCYVRAKEACRTALEFYCSLQKSREAFHSAAAEAKLLA